MIAMSQQTIVSTMKATNRCQKFASMNLPEIRCSAGVLKSISGGANGFEPNLSFLAMGNSRDLD
jgi:hypothetical protein